MLPLSTILLLLSPTVLTGLATSAVHEKIEVYCIDDYDRYCHRKPTGLRFSDGCRVCKCEENAVLCRKGECRFFARPDQDVLDYCDSIQKKNDEALRLFSAGGNKERMVSTQEIDPFVAKWSGPHYSVELHLDNADHLTQSERIEAKTIIRKMLDDYLSENLHHIANKQMTKHLELAKQRFPEVGDTDSEGSTSKPIGVASQSVNEITEAPNSQSSSKRVEMTVEPTEQMFPTVSPPLPTVPNKTISKRGSDENPSSPEPIVSPKKDKIKKPVGGRRGHGASTNGRRKAHLPIPGPLFQAPMQPSPPYLPSYYDNRPMMWGALRDGVGGQFYTLPLRHYELLKHFAVNEHNHRYPMGLEIPPEGAYPAEQRATPRHRRLRRHGGTKRPQKQHDTAVIAPAALSAERNEKSLSNKLKTLSALVNTALELLISVNETKQSANSVSGSPHQGGSIVKGELESLQVTPTDKDKIAPTSDADKTGQIGDADEVKSSIDLSKSPANLFLDEEGNSDNGEEVDLVDIVIKMEELMPGMELLARRETASHAVLSPNTTKVDYTTPTPTVTTTSPADQSQVGCKNVQLVQTNTTPEQSNKIPSKPSTDELKAAIYALKMQIAKFTSLCKKTT